jgi:hypothetical protein
VLSDVTINLRFQVNEVQEAPVKTIPPGRLESLWTTAFRDRVLPRLIGGFGLTDTEKAEVVAAIATDLTPREVRGLVREPGDTPLPGLHDLPVVFDPTVLAAATQGDPNPLVRASVTPIADSWAQIPVDIRKKIGTKADFTSRLTEATEAELTGELDKENAREELDAALRSRVDVLVRGAEIEDPSRIQTLTLTLRGADVEAVLSDHQPGTE